MSQTLKIREIGNSLGVTLSDQLREMGLQEAEAAPCGSARCSAQGSLRSCEGYARWSMVAYGEYAELPTKKGAQRGQPFTKVGEILRSARQYSPESNGFLGGRCEEKIFFRRKGLEKAEEVPRRKDLPRVPPPDHDIQVNCCRNPSCENFGVPPLKVVTVGGLSLTKPRVGQKEPHENKLVFKLLVNKNSIRSIARIAELSPKAVYDKVDFIHRQCLLFVADRERDLQNLRLRRLFISTDRQDYQVNWTDGAQVHFEYTCYAHYRLLRRLIGHAGKLRFFIDARSSIAAPQAFNDASPAGSRSMFWRPSSGGWTRTHRP